MTELTDNELNKRVHEIMGLCQHSRNLNNLKCKNCGVYYGETDKINFNVSWIGFGLMFEFMQKHKKKDNFRGYVWGKEIGHGEWADNLTDAYAWPTKLISPRPFAAAMCEFFLGRQSQHPQ